MRKFIFALSILVPLLGGPGVARSETTNAVLKFYIVSEQKIEGGKFIDTQELPKVGYIAIEPDLIVTRIKNVWRQQGDDYAIMVGTNGTQTVVPSHPLPSLSVTLESEDVKKFADLTKKATGKRLLVMLDEKPLTAPKVDESLENGGFAIGFKNESDLEKAEDAFKRLIR